MLLEDTADFVLDTYEMKQCGESKKDDQYGENAVGESVVFRLLKGQMALLKEDFYYGKKNC